mmetsp:Transcript_10790/g.14068  ORF Transcript_10790/g.14068 Transcript_10790/m.14068 type:complete len:144 (+) Transcript_10790:101-532(+)
MPSAWTEHVRKYAKDNNISYMCAISEASKTYEKKPVKKKTEPIKKKSEQVKIYNYTKEELGGRMQPHLIKDKKKRESFIKHIEEERKRTQQRKEDAEYRAQKNREWDLKYGKKKTPTKKKPVKKRLTTKEKDMISFTQEVRRK